MKIIPLKGTGGGGHKNKAGTFSHLWTLPQQKNDKLFHRFHPTAHETIEKPLKELQWNQQIKRYSNLKLDIF